LEPQNGFHYYSPGKAGVLTGLGFWKGLFPKPVLDYPKDPGNREGSWVGRNCISFKEKPGELNGELVPLFGTYWVLPGQGGLVFGPGGTFFKEKPTLTLFGRKRLDLGNLGLFFRGHS